MLLLCSKSFSTQWQSLDTLLALLLDCDHMVTKEANATEGATLPRSRNTRGCLSCFFRLLTSKTNFNHREANYKVNVREEYNYLPSKNSSRRKYSEFLHLCDDCHSPGMWNVQPTLNVWYRSPGGGEFSCLENLWAEGTWWATDQLFLLWQHVKITQGAQKNNNAESLPLKILI